MVDDAVLNQNDFKVLKYEYKEAFKLHGDSSAGLLLPKGRHDLRFCALDELLRVPGRSILDYGCGFAYLKDYITEKGFDVQYSGVDLSEEFIELCRKKHPDSEFNQIGPAGELDKEYDVIFFSGVFNIATSEDEETSKEYVRQLMLKGFDHCRVAMVADFLTDQVDFKAPGAQHFGVHELTPFCAKSLSRRFSVRHDILPYEWTLLVFKESTIQRPENIYP